MVRVISQETFDSVVKENVEELNMSLEEAVNDAKTQFEAQGVNLANIVMPGSSSLNHAILEAMSCLKNQLDQTSESRNLEDVAQSLDIITKECENGLSERVLATQKGAYSLLIQAVNKLDSVHLKSKAVTCLASLMNGNPDPLEEEGFKTLLLCLNSDDSPLVKATLEWCLNCCVRHEGNRQNLVHNSLLLHLNNVVTRYPVEVARIWQALVQDDDVRVPFGQAHEHARLIVEEHAALKELTTALNKSDSHENIALYLTCLSNLTVRNEYCQSVVDEGGLKIILSLLVEPDQNKSVVRECLRALKTLAGNDNVKKEINKAGGIPIITNAMTKHLSVKAISGLGCGALSAITLRSPENSNEIMISGGAQLLTQVLSTHQDTAAVMTACCNAIRNIVSRSREFNAQFIELDVERLLHEVRAKHPKTEDSVKAALRDLGLKVELKEQWKGGAVKQE